MFWRKSYNPKTIIRLGVEAQPFVLFVQKLIDTTNISPLF